MISPISPSTTTGSNANIILLTKMVAVPNFTVNYYTNHSQNMYFSINNFHSHSSTKPFATMTESGVSTNSSKPSNQSFIKDPDLIFTDAHLLSIILYSLIFLISSLANLANVTFMVSLNASRRTLYGTGPGTDWRRRAVGLPNSNSCGNTNAQAQTNFNAGSIVVQEYHQLAANLKRAIARKRTSTHFNSSYFRMRTLLLNLCVADLLVTFLLIPLEIAWRATVSWRAGDLACRLLMFVRIFGLYLSSFVLVCIAVDRYLSILHPLSVRYAEKRQRRMMWASWILSFLCSLPQSFIFHVASHPTHPDFKQCVTFSFFTSRRHELTYNVLCMMAMYGGPLLIILILYSKVLYKMHQSTLNIDGFMTGDKQQSQSGSLNFSTSKQRFKSAKSPRRFVSVHFSDHAKIRPYRKAQSKVANIMQFYSVRPSAYRHEINNAQGIGNNHDKKQVGSNHIPMQRHFDFGSIKKAQTKNLKLTIYIIIAFFCCWTPFYAMAMFFWFAPDMASKTSNYIQEIFFMFAVSNSCINPLIYGRFVCVSLRSKTWKSLGKERVQTSLKFKNSDKIPHYSRNNFYTDPYETEFTNGQMKTNKSPISYTPSLDKNNLLIQLPIRGSSSICYGNSSISNSQHGRKNKRRRLSEGISNTLTATMNDLFSINAIGRNDSKYSSNTNNCRCEDGCHCRCPSNLPAKDGSGTKITQHPVKIRQNSILLSIRIRDLKRKSCEANFFSKLKRPPPSSKPSSKLEIELRESPTTYFKATTTKCYEETTDSNKQLKPFYRVKEMKELKWAPCLLPKTLVPSSNSIKSLWENSSETPTKYQLLLDNLDPIDDVSNACSRNIKHSRSYDNFREIPPPDIKIHVGDSI